MPKIGTTIGYNTHTHGNIRHSRHAISVNDMRSPTLVAGCRRNVLSFRSTERNHSTLLKLVNFFLRIIYHRALLLYARLPITSVFFNKNKRPALTLMLWVCFAMKVHHDIDF
jgi:hypothetical protein